MFELILEGLLLLIALSNILYLKQDRSPKRFGIVGLAVMLLFLL